MLCLAVSIGVSALFVGALLVYIVSEADLRRDFSVSAEHLRLRAVPNPELVERGRHLASAVAQCSTCHGGDLAGVRVIDDFFVGRLYAPNLTRGEGGLGSIYRDTDWVRAIRFGVSREGRSLFLKPSEHLSAMSDMDLAAVIAYLRQVPSVHTNYPSTRIGPLIRIGMSLGLTPNLLSAPAVDRRRKPSVEMHAERTVEYGAYLADLGGCHMCHGADMRGGLHPLARPGEPVPPDLRRMGSMRDWTRENFARAMREGRTPEGRRLDPEFMPWTGYAGLTDLEIEALWLYLGDLR